MTENISMSSLSSGSCAVRSGWLDLAPRHAAGPITDLAGENSVSARVGSGSAGRLVPSAKTPATAAFRRERSADALLIAGPDAPFAYTTYDPGSHPRRFRV